MEENISFGTWIKQRRKAIDLTQRALAERMNCSLSTVVKIENDQRRPSRQIASLLAESLNLPLEEHDLFIKIAREQRSTELLESLSIGPQSPLTPLPRKSIYKLPTPPNPLIGRADELQEVTRLLMDPNLRILSVIGPFGVGKTRLSVEAGIKLKETAPGQFPDGIYFVPLASVADARFIPHAAAQSIGLNFTGSEMPENQLINFLRDKTLLLIIDNAEHIAQDAVVFSRISDQAPGVKILVTSQQRLNLSGEWVLVLHGLDVPPQDEVEAIENYSSVKFFIHRAQQSQINFSLVESDQPQVAQICSLLDGIPLGIELAATWVHMLPVKEIASEIARDLDFLTSPIRDIPERHRSLRVAFEYSWDLLTFDEQRSLCRLSIFRGGFTREAASAVAGVPLTTLVGFIDKSLLRRDKHSRYDLHELIRQYAAQRLAENEQEEMEARGHHSQYYLDLLNELEADLHGLKQRGAMDRLIPEIDNIRAAWHFAVENGRLDLIQKAAWSLWFFHEVRGYYRAGESTYHDAIMMVKAIQEGRTFPPEELQIIDLNVLLGELMMYQAHFIMRLNRYEQAEPLLAASISLLRSADNAALLGRALVNYAVLKWSTGDYEKAWILVEEAHPLSVKHGDTWQITYNLALKGILSHEMGEYQQAYTALETAMREANRIGDPRMISLIASYFSRSAMKLGRGVQVKPLLEDGMMLAIRIEDRFRLGLILEQLALVAQSEGDSLEAERLFTQAIDLYRELGHTWSVARLLVAKGNFELYQHEVSSAREHFERAFKLAYRSKTSPRILDACAGLAKCFELDGDYETALKLAFQVQKHPASTQDASEDSRQIITRVRDIMSEEELEKIEREIHAQDFDNLARFILDEIIQG